MKKSSFKSITLITRPGKGVPLVERLFKQGLSMVDLQHARGSVVGGPQNKKGQPIESEHEILTCIVPADQANDYFSLLYEWGEVDQPQNGFLYLQDLLHSTQVELPKPTETDPNVSSR